MGEEEIIGTDRFSGGESDDWAKKIKNASLEELGKLDDALDTIGGTHMKVMANWPVSRMKGLRHMIQDRYEELTGQKKWGK